MKTVSFLALSNCQCGKKTLLYTGIGSYPQRKVVSLKSGSVLALTSRTMVGV